MPSCELCGSALPEGSSGLCANCLAEQRQQWATETEGTLPNPTAQAEQEALIAVFVLSHPDQHDATMLQWAQSVVERYRPHE